jgi:hypothetical protein
MFALWHGIICAFSNSLYHPPVFPYDPLLLLAEDGLDRRVQVVAPDPSSPDGIDNQVVGLSYFPNPPERVKETFYLLILPKRQIHFKCRNLWIKYSCRDCRWSWLTSWAASNHHYCCDHAWVSRFVNDFSFLREALTHGQYIVKEVREKMYFVHGIIHSSLLLNRELARREWVRKNKILIIPSPVPLNLGLKIKIRLKIGRTNLATWLPTWVTTWPWESTKMLNHHHKYVELSLSLSALPRYFIIYCHPLWTHL